MQYSRRSQREPVPPPRKKRRRFPYWTLPVVVLTICLLFGAWAFANDQLASYDRFSAMREFVQGEGFLAPVTVDGVALKGLSMAQAREALLSVQRARAEAIEIVLVHGEQKWRITSAEVPLTWNTQKLLDQAYSIGRSGSLEQRYSQLKSISAPIPLESVCAYSREAVRPLTDAIAARLTVPSADAAVVAFDVVNRSFAFSGESAGQTVDAQRLYDTVIDHLDHGIYSATIGVMTEPVAPRVTRAQLEANYTRIASYTTKTTNDRERNTNIRLAAEAISGSMIQAGGTISFNETTGERTREKGYQEAGAIENGRTVKETGGGVCQVSSTMFNAMARAGCEIVTRKPHAWPSTYVPRGEDATVDWPRLDLVMKNPSAAPMFLVAWYEDRHVTVEVYGLSLGGGVTIDLASETTYTKKATEVVYTYNPALRVGTTQLLRNAHNAYAVQTYRVWLQDGKEVSREKFYTSDYRLINEEYEYNDGHPPA